VSGFSITFQNNTCAGLPLMAVLAHRQLHRQLSTLCRCRPLPRWIGAKRRSVRIDRPASMRVWQFIASKWAFKRLLS